MKATLCVFVALVAVTSAAPAFMGSNRRAACTDNAWCTTACKCDSEGAGGDDCTAATKFCAGVGASGVVTDACAHTDGTTALTAACTCGASTVTKVGATTAKAAFFSPAPSPTAPGYCYLSKASSSVAANTQASVGTCPKVTAITGKILDAPQTCGDTDSLNGCASGRVCTTSGECLPVCTVTSAGTPGSANGAACKCGSDFVDVPANGFCGLKSDGKGVALTKAACATAKADGGDDLSGASDICNCGTGAVKLTTATDKYCLIATGGFTGTLLTAPVCTTTSAGTPGSANGAACKCGSDFVDVPANGFCGLKSDGKGVALTKAACATAKADGIDDNSGASDICNCGTDAVKLTTATDKYCLLSTGGFTGTLYSTIQCAGTAANQGAGTHRVTANCMCGSTAITDAATTCKYCLASANYVAVGDAIAACSNDVGTAAYNKGPNKCKCGTGVVGYGEYCGSGLTPAINGPVAACSNNDGTVLNGATACACINSGTGVATVTAATTGLCNAGVSSTKAACTSTDGSAANTAPCTCGTATCTTGQKCTASTNTCATPPAPAPSPGTPAPPPSTNT